MFFLFILIEVCEITEVLFPSKQYKNCSFGVTLSDSDTEYVFSAEVLIRPLMQVLPKCCAFMWWGGGGGFACLEDPGGCNQLRPNGPWWVQPC